MNQASGTSVQNELNEVASSSQSANINIQRTKYLSAPYVPGTSERIQRALKPYNIKMSHKSCNKISNQVSNVKDRMNSL